MTRNNLFVALALVLFVASAVYFVMTGEAIVAFVLAFAGLISLFLSR